MVPPACLADALLLLLLSPVRLLDDFFHGLLELPSTT